MVGFAEFCRFACMREWLIDGDGILLILGCEVKEVDNSCHCLLEHTINLPLFHVYSQLPINCCLHGGDKLHMIRGNLMLGKSSHLYHSDINYIISFSKEENYAVSFIG